MELWYPCPQPNIGKHFVATVWRLNFGSTSLLLKKFLWLELWVKAICFSWSENLPRSTCRHCGCSLSYRAKSTRKVSFHICQVLWLVWVVCAFAWSITRCCASLQQRTAVVFLSFELDGPRKHSLNTVFPCFWRERALLLLPCSGTSIKGELCAGSRCGCRNPFKHCLWKSVIPLKSLRKAGKLICIRGALIL